MIIEQKGDYTIALKENQMNLYNEVMKCFEAQMLKSVKTHWQIENSCHWVLDIAFRKMKAEYVLATLLKIFQS